jgi:hypothetical protein
MQRIAGFDGATPIFIRERIGLDIDQPAFDIPETVFTLVAQAFNRALMQ